MAVGFSSYQIARSGLTASERGLYVTGHNLSNVNTPGYTRQQLMIESSPYYTTYTKNAIQQVGLGADIQEIRQIRHTFLDTIYRSENTSFGYWEARSNAYVDVQGILGDPMGVGLQNTMNQFWDSWQELSKDPDSLTTRALVRQRAQALVYQFNQVGTQLDRLQLDLNNEIAVRVSDVNNITKQVAQLNTQIMYQELNGDNANDYRDQRNYLVDQLSKLCDADVYEEQDGQYSITLGGYVLVSKSNSTNLYVEANATNGLFYTPMLEGSNTVVPIKGGTLKGLLESRGEVSGVKGSIENGSPITKADITFGIDVSAGSGSGSSEYLSKVKASIKNYVEDMKKSGIDFNIRIATINSNTSVHGPDMVFDANSIDMFLNDSAQLDALFTETADTAVSFDSFITSLEAINAAGGFRQDSAKIAMVFTNESIDGNSGVPLSDAAAYNQRLQALGMTTSVITDKSYYTQGEDSTEIGWEAITSANDGKLYDINTSADQYATMMTTLGRDTNYAFNTLLSRQPANNNIVSDIRVRLNAMVNSMLREINYYHSSGFTLDGKQGEDFFSALDDNYPMQLGNIKLNDNILSDNGLNNIVAAGTNAKGDNSIALTIANLRNADILSDESGVLSTDEYYRGIILNVGNGGQEAERTAQNQQKLILAAEDKRTSISGVSMDEEMSNMMKFKFHYNSCSKVLSSIDQMIETIVNRMGIVGR